MTRCVVSAVSVVLIGQMCRSCTASTPGCAARNRRTPASSIPGGTPSRPSFIESLNNRHDDSPITATITRLVAGSIHVRPVSVISRPAPTTPTETSASPAMWTNAARMLMSCLRPAMNSSAVAVLITIPAAATAIITPPSTG